MFSNRRGAQQQPKQEERRVEEASSSSGTQGSWGFYEASPSLNTQPDQLRDAEFRDRFISGLQYLYEQDESEHRDELSYGRRKYDIKLCFDVILDGILYKNALFDEFIDTKHKGDNNILHVIFHYGTKLQTAKILMVLTPKPECAIVALLAEKNKDDKVPLDFLINRGADFDEEYKEEMKGEIQRIKAVKSEKKRKREDKDAGLQRPRLK
jgi:hypothetical protein